MISQEKVTEKYLKNQVKKYGGKATKIKAIAERGWPDRLVLFPNGFICWPELKDTGKPLDPLQKVIHKILWSMGQQALRIDTKEKVDQMIFHAVNGIPITRESNLAQPE